MCPIEEVRLFDNSGCFGNAADGDIDRLEVEARRYYRTLVELWPFAAVSKADFAVITIREDENASVLRRLPNTTIIAGKNLSYAFGTLSSNCGKHVSVSCVRTPAQGPGAAQDTARSIIEDLNPRWIAVVGICGAVPDNEFTLGDVIVASRLHAFTIGALEEGKPPEMSDQGGPMSREAENFVGLIKALEPQVDGWQSDASISFPRPGVSLKPANFYGPDDIRRRNREILKGHFGGRSVRSHPIVTTRPLAAGHLLVKDTGILEGWRKSARHIAGVEMELPGIYEAARRIRKEYPILAVRGISDIVGFKRSAEWTRYACETAASCFVALVRAMPEHFLS
jgi:nucleoside phosphorylase